jgi:hypothetical protein
VAERQHLVPLSFTLCSRFVPEIARSVHENVIRCD